MLGTAHVSQASAAEVARVVAAVQPQCVVVELCKSRVGVLQLPEQQQQLEEAQIEQWQQQQEQLPLGMAVAASSDSAVNSSEEDLQAAAIEALQPHTSSTSGNSSSSSSNSSSSGSSSKVSDWQLQRASNPMSLSGSSFVGALTRSAQLGGQSGLLLRLLIAGQARKAAGGRAIA
jgi:hypothetical protein